MNKLELFELLKDAPDDQDLLIRNKSFGDREITGTTQMSKTTFIHCDKTPFELNAQSDKQRPIILPKPPNGTEPQQHPIL